jgi:hypothetical protein
MESHLRTYNRPAAMSESSSLPLFSIAMSGLALAAQLKHATTSSSEVPCPRNLAHLQ